MCIRDSSTVASLSFARRPDAESSSTRVSLSRARRRRRRRRHRRRHHRARRRRHRPARASSASDASRGARDEGAAADATADARVRKQSPRRFRVDKASSGTCRVPHPLVSHTRWFRERPPRRLLRRVLTYIHWVSACWYTHHRGRMAFHTKPLCLGLRTPGRCLGKCPLRSRDDDAGRDDDERRDDERARTTDDEDDDDDPARVRTRIGRERDADRVRFTEDDDDARARARERGDEESIVVEANDDE